jgi:hypothetical protein
MSRIVEPFSKYPKEAGYISSMVAGYGELESDLFSCVASVLGASDLAARILFRVRSEAQRIDVADAILRPKLAEGDTAPIYADAIGRLRWCRSVRNQYAHCHWHDSGSTLEFYNMERVAQSSDGVPLVKFIPVDIILLEELEAFFFHTRSLLRHLRGSHEIQLGKLTTQIFPAPEPKHPPKKHSLAD